jgi:hypothetical protein
VVAPPPPGGRGPGAAPRPRGGGGGGGRYVGCRMPRSTRGRSLGPRPHGTWGCWGTLRPPPEPSRTSTDATWTRKLRRSRYVTRRCSQFTDRFSQVWSNWETWFCSFCVCVDPVRLQTCERGRRPEMVPGATVVTAVAAAVVVVVVAAAVERPHRSTPLRLRQLSQHHTCLLPWCAIWLLAAWVGVAGA